VFFLGGRLAAFMVVPFAAICVDVWQLLLCSFDGSIAALDGCLFGELDI